MTTGNQLRIEMFEAITIKLRELIASASDEHLAAFTDGRMGRDSAWIQEIAWDEIRRRQEADDETL